MSTLSAVKPVAGNALKELWFTRCPVPTATGLAYRLGWFDDEFAADGIRVETLQESRQLGHHHYDHNLPSLIREGGALPALAARAQGAPTRLIGTVVGIDLDQLPARRYRVDNGTPRPITVHQSLIDDHFDVLVRFLERTLGAADWAADHLDDVHEILQQETRGSVDAVGDSFHKNLHPNLSDERLQLLEREKNFAWLFGFQEHDIDIAEWVDPRPLEAALKLREERRRQGR